MQVKVEVCVTEAEERAPAVGDAARRHGASLLVLGQRRRAATTRLLRQCIIAIHNLDRLVLISLRLRRTGKRGK